MSKSNRSRSILLHQQNDEDHYFTMQRNNPRNQSDIDAAVMLASFTAHVDEVPLSAENGSFQSDENLVGDLIILGDIKKCKTSKVKASKQIQMMPKQLQSNDKFPTMVRITHSTSIYFFLSTPPT